MNDTRKNREHFSTSPRRTTISKNTGVHGAYNFLNDKGKTRVRYNNPDPFMRDGGESRSEVEEDHDGNRVDTVE